MKKYAVLLVLITQALICAAQTSSQLKTRLAVADSVIERIMKDWKIAGLAVGVVYKDEVIYSKGYGYRDLEKQLPVTPHTTFSIASCTKAFTAMTVGIAANDGLFKINEPVHNYFPELEFYTPLLTSMITAQDMMTHRTGIPRHDWMTHSKLPLPLDSVIHRIRYIEPSAGFREKAQYSNLMYTALGALTQKVTGKPWEQQIKERILQPLGMEETSTAYSDLPLSKEFSRGYRESKGVLVAGNFSAEGVHPAGSINSSVSDMCKWLSAWINGGKVAGRQIFPASFVKDASTPQMATPSRPNPAFLGYGEIYFGDFGYGWVVDSYRGHYRVQHSGDLPLYASNTSFCPSDSVGIVVLVNKFNSIVPETIAQYLADMVLNIPSKDWNGLTLERMNRSNPSVAQTAQANLAFSVPLKLPVKEYAGTYTHPGYGTMKIIINGDNTLSATHNDQTIVFSHLSGEVFKAGVPNDRLEFFTGPNSKIQAISGSLQDGVKDIVFVKSD